MSGRTKYPDKEVPEPVDYDRLAKCYVAEKWRWHTVGYPNATQIKEAFDYSVDHVKRQIGETGFINSGGITAKWIDGKIAVLVHAKLAQHYFKDAPATKDAPVTETKNEGIPVCRVKSCCNPCQLYGGYSVQCEMHNKIAGEKRRARSSRARELRGDDFITTVELPCKVVDNDYHITMPDGTVGVMKHSEVEGQYMAIRKRKTE